MRLRALKLSSSISRKLCKHSCRECFVQNADQVATASVSFVIVKLRYNNDDLFVENAKLHQPRLNGEKKDSYFHSCLLNKENYCILSIQEEILIMLIIFYIILLEHKNVLIFS